MLFGKYLILMDKKFVTHNVCDFLLLLSWILEFLLAFTEKRRKREREGERNCVVFCSRGNAPFTL